MNWTPNQYTGAQPVYKNSKASCAKSLILKKNMKNNFLGDGRGYFSVSKNHCSKTIVRDCFFLHHEMHTCLARYYRESTVCVSTPSLNKYDWLRLWLGLWWECFSSLVATMSSGKPSVQIVWYTCMVCINTCLLELKMFPSIWAKVNLFKSYFGPDGRKYFQPKQTSIDTHWVKSYNLHHWGLPQLMVQVQNTITI